MGLSTPHTSTLSNITTAVDQSVDLGQPSQTSEPPILQSDLFAYYWYHHTIAFVAVSTWTPLFCILWMIFFFKPDRCRRILLASTLVYQLTFLIAWTASCSIATLVSSKKWSPLSWLQWQLQSLKRCFGLVRMMPWPFAKETENARAGLPSSAERATQFLTSKAGKTTVTVLVWITWRLWFYGLMILGMLKVCGFFPMFIKTPRIF